MPAITKQREGDTVVVMRSESESPIEITVKEGTLSGDSTHKSAYLTVFGVPGVPGIFVAKGDGKKEIIPGVEVEVGSDPKGGNRIILAYFLNEGYTPVFKKRGTITYT